jgi:MFS transporter, DHA1 family, multidrug resistance protein
VVLNLTRKTQHAGSIEEAGEGGESWRRSQLGMTLVVFIAFFGFNFVMPILPLYVRHLGVEDVAQAALISGAMLAISPLMAAFFSPLWGLVADRYGRKRMVQRSLLVMTACCVLMGLVTNVWQLFGLRAVIGVFGGFTAMSMAYLVTVTPAAQASVALGLMQSAQVGGTIVGPLCAGFIADHFGLRASFFSGAVVVFLGCVVLTLLTQDDRQFARAASPAESSAAGSQPTQSAVTRKTGGLASLREAAQLPGLLAVMAILFLAQLVDRSFGPILPLYVASLGTEPDRVASYSGLIVSLGAMGTALSAWLVGHLASRLPVRRVLIITLIAGVVLCLPLAFVQTPLQLLVARTLLGLFAGGTLTLAYSMGNTIIPPERKAAAFGVLSSTALLGSAISPLATGALARIDLRAIFFLDAALYVVALVWAQRAKPRVEVALAPSTV